MNHVFLTLALFCLSLLVNCSQQVELETSSELHMIDTHIHLWDLAMPGGPAWPPPEETVLYRSVLPAHYDAICASNKVDRVIVVEAAGDGRWSDNQWLLDITKHAPERYCGVVGNLPIGTDEFEGMLNTYAADKRFIGIRMRQRPDGINRDTFFTAAVWRDLALLEAKGLKLDVLLANFSLADIDAIATRLPNLPICINHLTGLTIPDQNADADWIASVKQAATHSNVVCKVSGIFERTGQQPAPKDAILYIPVFDIILKAFGEDRILYGSNWPVSDRGGRYEEQLAIIKDWATSKGIAEKLFSKNAAAFYGI